MNYYAMMSFFNGFVALAVGFYAFSRSRQNEIYISFGSFLISISLWAIFNGFFLLQTDQNAALILMRITMAFCYYIPTTFLWFVESLREEKPKDRIIARYFLVPTLFAFANATPYMIPRVVPKSIFLFWPDPAPAMILCIICFNLVAIYAFILLFKSWFGAIGERRWQLQWITLTTLCMWGGGSSNWFLWFDINIPPAPNFFVAAFLLLLTYGVIRRRLFDIEVISRLIRETRLSAIGTLAASINHEIKNPLFIARGLAESYLINRREGLTQDLSPLEREEQASQILERVVMQVNRAVDTIKQFADLAKSRPNAYLKEQLYLEDILTTVLQYAGHELEHRKIKVERPSRSDVRFVADRKQSEEIFLNLIVNACHAMPEGGRLKISDSQQNDIVSVCVEDTGVGMQPESLRKIFDPFYTTKSEGTGLGLYITKQLVERNGGKISVRSKVGEGTAFVLEFKQT